MRNSSGNACSAALISVSGSDSSASTSAERNPVEECSALAASCQSVISSVGYSDGCRCFLR
ncbi:Uncharacterised protein [Mycobacterium tuberculosis]|nr:Uncharacterised protein [Mycobacterium tuberculosis]